MQVSGRRSPDAGLQTQVTGCRSADAGHRMQVPLRATCTCRCRRQQERSQTGQVIHGGSVQTKAAGKEWSDFRLDSATEDLADR